MSINGNKRKARFFQKSNFAFLWSLHVLYTSANDQFFHRGWKKFCVPCTCGFGTDRLRLACPLRQKLWKS